MFENLKRECLLCFGGTQREISMTLTFDFKFNAWFGPRDLGYVRLTLRHFVSLLYWRTEVSSPITASPNNLVLRPEKHFFSPYFLTKIMNYLANKILTAMKNKFYSNN
jgi:hypothetical protein